MKSFKAKSMKAGFDRMSPLISSVFMASGVDDGVDMFRTGFDANCSVVFAVSCTVVNQGGRNRGESKDVK